MTSAPSTAPVPAASLRRRLLALLLGGTAVFWAIVGGVSYYNAHHEVDELFDLQMVQLAHALMAVALSDDENMDANMPWPGGGHGRHHRRMGHAPQLMFQLRDGEGHLLLKSPNAPAAPLTLQEGFAEVRDGSGHWRYFAFRDPGGRYEVQVGQDHAMRDEVVQKTVAQFLLPILLGVPLLGFWVWHAIGRGLSPLAGLRNELEQRGPDDLSALSEEKVPEEISPLVRTLNALLGRVSKALEGERRFTSDAAHELRTPLAAMQTQLQVARRARDEGERNHALEQMQEGLARTSRLVEQMLHLARLDPEHSLPALDRLDLEDLARDVCAELGPRALAKAQDFELEAEPAVVNGSPDWIRVLVRNLVDNAIRYTPDGGRIRVHVGQHGDWLFLQVADSGPGIPPERHDAALARFRRLDETGQAGHGLGLSIVARIAELHHARLTLSRSAELGGLDVSVAFPRPVA